MSAVSTAKAADFCCALCGKAEVDDVKLKPCDKCDLARYCSIRCQKKHRPRHKTACKKRAAALRDEILFRLPESSHVGDCPICFLPLPHGGKNVFVATCCCCKFVCKGCAHANENREREQRLKLRCPFCRELLPKTKEEAKKMTMKRVEANDSGALRQMGYSHYHEGNYGSAFEYWARAAALGDAEGHYELSILYHKGQGVEKDEEMEAYHSEEAAIAGHPIARYDLGCYEWDGNRFDRAVKHWIIAANLGNNKSINELKDCYKDGHVSKDDLASALRAHQAAVDATKSPQREVAEQFMRKS